MVNLLLQWTIGRKLYFVYLRPLLQLIWKVQSVRQADLPTPFHIQVYKLGLESVF